jgi:hypothetical protein
MGRSKDNDPTQLWRTLISEMEKSYNSIAAQAMNSEQFSQAMNQTGGMTFASMQLLNNMMEQYLSSVNLPSRAQMLNVAQRLHNIEAELIKIRQELQRRHTRASTNSSGSIQSIKPARTKIPPPATGGEPS